MKLAIFASGKGSTAEAIFDKAAIVLTNKPVAGIIERAKKAGVPCEVLLKADFKVSDSNGLDKEASLKKYGQVMLNLLEKYQVEFISQNGWETLTPKEVVKKFSGKIVNAHAGPLDPGHLDFGGKGMYGLALHQAVLNFKRKINRPFNSEVCLHLATEEFDKGDLVAMKEVEVNKDDTAETLQQRVKEEERKLLREFWSEVEKNGEIKTIKREERVIKPGEEQLLEEAKEEAIEEYAP